MLWSIDCDFRGGNDRANADVEPLSDVDEQPQERHLPWPEIFIILEESVNLKSWQSWTKDYHCQNQREHLYFQQ